MDQPPSALGGSDIESPLTFDTPAELSALDFVGHGAFHQFIRCPRTGMRVSFSEAGPQNGVPILFLPPSFCTRYVGGPTAEHRARHWGVRVITIDRPGMGGTDRCKIQDRIEVATKHVASVLEYLGLKKVSVFTHSAGAIYALNILARHSELIGPSPRVYLSSAWVPTSLSAQFGLQLLPSTLIEGHHALLPAALPVLKGIGAGISLSSGLLNHSKNEKEKKEDHEWQIPERFRKEGEKYQPKPPYHTRLAASAPIAKCIDKCALAESLQGVSQDYLLCLGRGGPVSEAWYRTTVAEIAKGYAERNDKVTIEVWWGEEDGLIPKKGRDWLDDVISNAGDSIVYSSIEMMGMDHDSSLPKIEMIGAIFEDIVAHAESTA